jgi:ubiquinone/menaquinone biosynthesis C-methylase UbiE
MDFKKTVREGYNAIAGRYLEERTRASEDVRLIDDFIARLPAGARVLDAGCGAGVPISQMLSERFKVTGVDFSEEQIARARQHVPNATFLCEDMTELDFPENSFEGICSYYAIIHVPRQEHAELLASFHRMLKPGGIVLLCLGAESLVDDVDEDYLGTRMYWSHYDAKIYLGLLRDCGYTIIWSKTIMDATCEGAGHLFVLAQK